jgi:25S rRNA (cytosine2870-C5)-methyltransferase
LSDDDDEEKKSEESQSVLDDNEDNEDDSFEKMFSDDSSDEDELKAANMEVVSAKLDSFAREDILAAQDELLNPKKVVPEGVLAGSEQNEELSSVKTRITEIVKVLEDFNNLREPEMKRKDYMDRLVDDVSKYYGYNTYLAQKFLEMFSVSEVLLCNSFIALNWL